MFVCILIAKGWTITTNHLDQPNIIKGIMILILVLYVALFIYDYVGRDPASTMYFYDSAVGYLVIILRVAIMIWFMYSIRQTYSLEDNVSKNRFYLAFGSLAAAWFLVLPLLVLIALGIVDYERYRVITGFLLIVDTVAWVSLVILFWHTRVYEYFTVKPTALQSSLVVSKDAESVQGNYDSL